MPVVGRERQAVPLMGLVFEIWVLVLGSGGGGGWDAEAARGERKTPFTTLLRAAVEDSDGLELLLLALMVLPSYQGRFEVRAVFTTSYTDRSKYSQTIDFSVSYIHTP